MGGGGGEAAWWVCGGRERERRREGGRREGWSGWRRGGGKLTGRKVALDGLDAGSRTGKLIVGAFVLFFFYVCDRSRFLLTCFLLSGFACAACFLPFFLCGGFVDGRRLERKASRDKNKWWIIKASPTTHLTGLVYVPVDTPRSSLCFSTLCPESWLGEPPPSQQQQPEA